MAIPEWPSSLPQEPLTDGYSERPETLTVRSKMDKGPSKVRRLASLGVRIIPQQMLMSSTQVETFETFFEDSLANGVYRFSHYNPRTEESVEYRFVAGQDGPYTISPTPSSLWWTVSFQLEVLP